MLILSGIQDITEFQTPYSEDGLAGTPQWDTGATHAAQKWAWISNASRGTGDLSAVLGAVIVGSKFNRRNFADSELFSRF